MKTLIKNKLYKYAFVSIFFLLPFLGNATSISDSNGVWTVQHSGDTIKIWFKPDSLKVNCPQIGLVQTVKATFYDAAGGNPMVVNPGTLSPRLSQMADDYDSTTGTVVDNLWCEKDEYINGTDPQDAPNQQGSSAGNGTATGSAYMWDPPFIPNDLFPPGKEKVVLEFEVCAICMSGGNKGQCYGCIKWKYERTKDGGRGANTLVSGAPAARSAAHDSATAKFKGKHTSGTTTFCPEDSVQNAINAFVKYMNSFKIPSFFRANHPTSIWYADKRTKKGSAVPGMTLPTLPTGTNLSGSDFLFVPSGDAVVLKRTGIIPATDSQIPFLASFIDLFYGGVELVETGVLSGFLHGGVRVKNCSGLTLCAAAPSNSTNPNGHVMFTTMLNNTTMQVVFKNNALSSHMVNCRDVIHAVSTTLNPGDSVVYNFPGQMPSCVSTLNLKLFIQGYHTGGSGMTPVLMNQGQPSKVGECDSIDVELHSPGPPFNLVQSTRTILNQDGTAKCYFPPMNGNFFLAIKHRNAVETWSAFPIQVLQGEASYDFSNAAWKAFGDNQIPVAPGVWAFYQGDLNDDGSIDLLDITDLENDVNAFIFGYDASDLNGDGSVDLLDITPLEININNFIFSHMPN